MLEQLVKALVQCLSIVALGALCRLFAVLSPPDAAGVSAFVARLSMPALLFLAMAELDLASSSMVETWQLLVSVCAAKAIVFVTTACLCFTAARRQISTSGREEKVVVQSCWLRRAGLYGIAATQSNDFALGIPLCAAVWGDRFNSIIYLTAPFQLAVLNPAAFILLECGKAAADRAEGACSDAVGDAPVPTAQQLPDALAQPAGQVLFRGADGGIVSSGRRGVSVGVAASPNHPHQQGGGLACSAACTVARSPLILSVLLGAAARLALLACGNAALPDVVAGVLSPLKQAFTATSLVTLGLSLHTSSAPLAQKPLSAVGLLCAKGLLMPLLTRVIAETLGVESPDARSFAFLYGMLPSAPTVVVFAREYGQAPGFLAAVQFVGLLVAVPLLVVSTVALQLPTSSPTAARSSLRGVSQVAAAISAVASAFTLALLLHSARRGAGPFGRSVSRWLATIALSALAASGSAFVQHTWGQCAGQLDGAEAQAADPSGSGLLSGAILSGFIDWVLLFLKGQTAGLALVMAHQACPERSATSTTHGQRRWHALSLVAAAVAPALVRAAAALDSAVIPLELTVGCGHTSRAGLLARIALNVLYAATIVGSLALVRLAPSAGAGAAIPPTHPLLPLHAAAAAGMAGPVPVDSLPVRFPVRFAQSGGASGHASGATAAPVADAPAVAALGEARACAPGDLEGGDASQRPLGRTLLLQPLLAESGGGQVEFCSGGGSGAGEATVGGLCSDGRSGSADRGADGSREGGSECAGGGCEEPLCDQLHRQRVRLSLLLCWALLSMLLAISVDVDGLARPAQQAPGVELEVLMMARLVDCSFGSVLLLLFAGRLARVPKLARTLLRRAHTQSEGVRALPRLWVSISRSESLLNVRASRSDA